MAVHRLRFVVALIVTSLFFLSVGPSSSQAGDGPNRVSQSDVAVGSFIDSLFEPELRRMSSPQNRNHAPRRRVARRRTGLRAKLVNNPDTSDGSPPFALVDRYGGVLRYVEPVESIDLESYLGDTVAVRHDTGDILLASQLAFPRNSSGNDNFQLAAFAEPTLADGPESIPAGEIVGESVVGEPIFMPEEHGPVYFDEDYSEGYNEGIDFGGCPDCGRGVSQCRAGGCGYGARGVLYARGEYLLWWFDGMDVPELVIEGQAIPGSIPPAVGTNPSFLPTNVLFGGNEIFDESRDGGRILLGVWLDEQTRWALEGDYLGFNDLSTRFSASGNGTDRILGRPFIDARNGVFAREDVSFPGIQGTVTVNADSSFDSVGLRLRHNLCCMEGCNTGCGDSVSCGSGVGCGDAICGMACNNLCRILRRGVRHTDVTYGIRYAQLDESLRVREDLTVIAANPPAGFPNPPGIGTTFLVNDSFATSNEFLGGEIGFIWEWEHRRWLLELRSKLAIGNNRQNVVIRGSTVPTPPGAAVPDPVEPGGLLALRSNIGNYSQDELSVMPELGFTVGFALTQRLRLTAGYTFLYWSNVVRPGDQIDPVLDTTQIPRFDGTSTTAILPRFVFHETDLWAQGINVGADYRW